MQDFAKRFYRSQAWKACRAAYIARRLAIDGGLCEECRDQQGYIVHHRVTLTPENILEAVEAGGPVQFQVDVEHPPWVQEKPSHGPPSAMAQHSSMRE